MTGQRAVGGESGPCPRPPRCADRVLCGELLREIPRQPRPLGNGERELARLAVPGNGDAGALTGPERVDARDVVLVVADGLAVDGGDDVAAEQVLVALEDEREAAAANAGAIGGAAVVDDLD